MRPGETRTRRDSIEVEAFRRFLETVGPVPVGAATTYVVAPSHAIIVSPHWYAYAVGSITAAEALEVDDLRRIAA